ncbi:hypothetical protein LTR50_006400 [Elasticomyces elasticus]|nr:hypothetical protein LTR50_006400 [Elasticomyces elasticus]
MAPASTSTLLATKPSTPWNSTTTTLDSTATATALVNTTAAVNDAVQTLGAITRWTPTITTYVNFFAGVCGTILSMIHVVIAAKQLGAMLKLSIGKKHNEKSKQGRPSTSKPRRQGRRKRAKLNA